MKSKLIFVVLGLFILLGAIVLVSAGWFGDFFKNVFGDKNAVQGTKEFSRRPPDDELSRDAQNISPHSTSNTTINSAKISPISRTCKFILFELGNYSGLTGEESCRALGYVSCGFIREFIGTTYYYSNDNSCRREDIQAVGHRDKFKNCSSKIYYGNSTCLVNSVGKEPFLGDVSTTRRTEGVLCCT